MSSANILHQAIENQDMPTIKRILRECQTWESTDKDGETVFHLALKSKSQPTSHQWTIIQILECFLDEGLNANEKNAAGQTVLFSAVESRLQDVIDYLVQRGANVNVRDQKGNSIIHILIEDQYKRYPKNASSDLLEFVEQDDINFMNWLLSKGVNVDCQNNDGKSAFFLAVERNLIHVIPTLIEYMDVVNYFDESGCTIIESFFKARALCQNSYYRDFSKEIENVKFFLDNGVSVDHVDKKGNTLFHTYLKLYDENPETMQCMLQRYTKVNAQDQDGNTALHLVIRNGMAEYTTDDVRTLISKGANVHVKNNFGETIVCQAFRVKNADVLKVLVEHGADVSAFANPRALFLHDISSVSKKKDRVWAPMVDTLVQAGWNVNAVSPGDHFTPLMVACKSRCPAIAQRLIDNGANVNYVEKQNLTRAIHVAMDNCTDWDVNTEIFFKMLAKAGAKVNAKNGNGQTALHLVPACGYSVMKELLKLGAHVDARDNEGRLPLHEAVRNRDVRAIKALLEYGAEVNDESLLEEFDDIELPGAGAADYLIEEGLMLKAANLPVIDGLVDYAEENYFQEFYVDCLEEVETLKAHHLSNKITLYDLLHMDVHLKYVFMVKNEVLKELVESPLLPTTFPIYYISILARYNKAVARYPLVEPAKEAWQCLTGINLPEYCIERILAYLGNEDLRVMAEKEEEVNTLKRPSQLMTDESTKRKRLN